jgi:xylulokinase
VAVTSTDDLVAGVDVGSQGTCVQLLAADGEHVATSYVPHDLEYPRPGWAQQDAEQWVAALARGLLEARLASGGRRIAAIAFGAQLDGLVACDEAGRPLHPALIWMDRRAGAECRAAAGRIDAAALRAATGCNLDAGHVAAKIAWVQAHAPEVARATRHWLLPGSFVALRASGVAAVDPSNASSSMLYDVAGGGWEPAACAAFGVDQERLAPIRPPQAVLGEVAPWLRDAAGLGRDTLVVLGCGDEMAATLGAGVVDPGAICDVLGTAEPVCAVSDRPLHDPSGITELHPHALPGAWLVENPGWLSGGAYRWFRDQVGGPELSRAAATGEDAYELLNALAASVPRGADGLLWLPALAGAMTPEWNADARACWFGLTAAHGRAHLLRALLEGNALAFRDVVEAVLGAGGEAREIVCVGGGARGALIAQLRADVTGLPACRPADVETTARGAAMLAAAGAGLHPSVRAAAVAMAGERVGHVEPDPQAREVYDALYDRYRALYAALKPLFAPA